MVGCRSARAAILLLAIAPLAADPHDALAAWPHDPNNGNVALCTAAGDQNFPVIVSDEAGGAIVTWYDLRGGATYDIYAQRVNAAGVPQWTANGVALCTAASDQYYPAIASDGAGGAIVTWYDGRSGINSDIYAQRVNAAGVPQWTANGVALCTAADFQHAPTIVSDGAGGAIVTWYDHRSGINYDIYAQRVNSAGVPQWTPDGVPLCTAASDQYSPTIESDGAGGAIVTWLDLRSGTYDIYAQRVNLAGVLQWTADGVALCTAAGSQYDPRIASDGTGGAIVTWYDQRSGPGDIYAQRVNAAGAPQWIADGVALCTTAFDQFSPTIVSDGAGGAVVTWYDYRSGTNTDIYAQRVNAVGAPQWIANGVALCTAVNFQQYPTIASDAAGGAIVTWYDYRSGTSADIYVQRVSAVGVPQWTVDGVALCTATSYQQDPTIAPDGAGGAIVTWHDYRNGPGHDIYAQRIDRYGRLGQPEATLTNVHDFPADQGGKVRIAWSRSYLDTIPTLEIGSYGIWRQVSGSLASQLLARGAQMVSDEAAAANPRPGSLRRIADVAQSTYWEGVGSILARGDASYTFVAATFADSTAASNPRTTFMIDAHSAFLPGIWDSAPDSGYSVDNIPPFAPAPFTGAYGGGATHLHWGQNAEVDLAGYHLYRGSSAGFTPGPGNLISAQPDTGYNDVGAAGSYYKLAAVDVHDNQSAFALLTPAGTLGAPGPTLPSAVWFVPPAPNPVRDGAMFRFGLPSESRVSLVLFDQQGRRVRDLEGGTLPAGEHAVSWDGRDAQGHLMPSGLYFSRLSVGGRNFIRRLAVAR